MDLTRLQAQQLDQYAIQALGIPSAVLMENAGRNAAQMLLAQMLLAQRPQGEVLICCGKGNNGGDGLVVARHLANAGVAVRILLFAEAAQLSPECALHWNIVSKLNLPRELNPQEAAWQAALSQAEWVVDALYGTGLRGPLGAPLDRLIAALNGSRRPVLALDIPSGLDADSGQPLGPTVRATHTVTFVAPKRGFANPEAQQWLGTVHTVDIGVAARFLQEGSTTGLQT